MSTDDHEIEPLQREAHDWITRFARGDANSADLEAMKSWYVRSPAHAAAYVRARRLWRALGPVALDGMKTERPYGATLAPPTASRRAFLGGALAASVAGVGCALVRPPFDLWPSFAQLTSDYRTAVGEQRQIKVADTVSLELNTRTSVTIRSESVEAAHIELVAGEAMVAVGNRTRPLIVSAAGGRSISSHGKFNIRYERTSLCTVSCLEGEVRVEQGGAGISLAASQQVYYGAQGVDAVTVSDLEAVTAWQNDLLIFKFTPVAKAIEEVNRYRPGRIVLLNDDIGRRVLNARFRIQDADKVIGQIVRIFGAKATFLPGGMVVLT